MNKPRLFIIDAFAHIFRAYYAVKHIDLNAAFGFTSILKKILETERPEYCVVAFDTPGPTFRKEIYPEYKANRDAPPEDLEPQIPMIKEIIGAYNIPIIQVDGFEADDVIGTLAKKGREAGIQVVIASGDKDMLQLVHDNDVVMFDPNKGVHYMGEDKVADYFGVEAKQIIDLLTLWGDSSDNIPGVSGIGEKGAKNLINKYKTVQGIYDHIDEITRKAYLKGLEEAKDKIELYRELVTIRQDLDIQLDLEKFKVEKPNNRALKDIFTRLKFKAFLDDVPEDLDTRTREYVTIQEEKGLKAFIQKAKKAGTIIFDTETNSLNPHEAELAGVALGIPDDAMVYVPLRHPGVPNSWIETAEPLLKELLAEPNLTKIAHNIKYDLSVLKALDWQVSGPFEDTMLMSYLINPTETRHGLDELAEKLLSYKTIYFEEVAGSKKEQVSFDNVLVEQATQYAAEDVDICWQLYALFKDQIEELGLSKVYREIEMPLVHVLIDMEMEGIEIDDGLLANLSKTFAAELAELEKEAHKLAAKPFNLKSPKQVGEILFEDLGLPVMGKTSKTKSYSTSSDVLEKLAKMGYDLPKVLIEFREMDKLKGTYIDTLPTMVDKKTGRVHTDFNQTITATGRLSSNNPNLQNIPIRTELGREIRAAFIPREGWTLVAADYSQIELRLLAHLSEDPILIEGFQTGEDIHARTASEIMDVNMALVTPEMRSAAKTINFGLIYGMGEYQLSQDLGIPRKQAANYIEAYFERMPKVKDFQARVIEESRETGEIRTIFGRRRLIPEINSRNKMLQRRGERLAINTLVQGSAAEVIKLAMIKFHHVLEENHLAARMLLQVHDELVVECPKDEIEKVSQLLAKTMENVMTLKVPLVAEAHSGPNWKECKA